MLSTYALETPIIRKGHTDAEIICEDKDGDGYYNWGIGPKPSHCPAEAQILPDGNDSDPLQGPMNEYGFTMNLNPNDRDTIFINTDESTHNPGHMYNHIVVQNNATFTVVHDLTCHNGVKIIVRNGATLLVDCMSTISNANIVAEPNSTIKIKNGSNIKLSNSQRFSATNGSTFNLVHGKIE